MASCVMNVVEVKKSDIFECVIGLLQNKETMFDFNNLIPVGYNASSTKKEYEWGTSSNAFDAVVVDKAQSFYFSTAGFAPFPIMKAFAEITPDMHFVWTWADEKKGLYNGKYTYNDGIFVGGFALDGTKEAHENYTFCWEWG